MLRIYSGGAHALGNTGRDWSSRSHSGDRTAAAGGFACGSYSTEKFNLTVPYCLDMTDNDLLTYPVGNPVAVANGSASVTYEATGSYNSNGCVKVVPDTTGDNYAGLGNFNFSPNIGSQMNVRYLIYCGYSMVDVGVKMNICDGDVAQRPMVISREYIYPTNTSVGFDYMIPIPSQNVEESPTLQSGYPNSPTFFFANASVSKANGNYAHEWVCIEFEIITTGSPILNLYIHTQDGVISHGQGSPWATHFWNAGAGDFNLTNVGWYWGPGWTVDSETYFKFSDFVVNDSYIGPPSGFVT